MHSRQINTGKLDIHYFTGGEGEPLVIIHGGGVGARSWLQNATELCEHYRVYIPDLPGFGLSQPINNDHGISEFVDFLEDFSHSLGLKRFHLVGHSIGGGIALHYALKFPHKISKLVLVNSMCLGKEIALWVRVLSSSVLCRSLGLVAAATLKAIKWLVDTICAPLKFMNPLPPVKVNMGKNITTLKEQTMVVMNQLATLVMPTLLVWGSKDGIVPVSHSYAAAKLIPDCQLHIFENCGHSVHQEKPEELSRLLAQFLR